MNLTAADIEIERPADLVFDIHGPPLADLARVRPPLLCVGILFGDLRKGTIEHRDIMLHSKTDIGLLIHREVARCLPIRRPQRDDLVAILVLDSNPAVIKVVPDIAPAKDDEARFDLLFIEDETYVAVSYCAETVQIGVVVILP